MTVCGMQGVSRARLRWACSVLSLTLIRVVDANAAEDTTGGSWLHIELSPQVALERPAVYLGDMAALRSPDLALLRRAMALPMGSLSSLSGGWQLDRELIVDRLLRRQVVKGAQIRWAGAPSSLITLRTQLLPGSEVLAVARQALHEHLLGWLASSGVMGVSPELSPAFEPGDILQPGQGNKLRARPLTAAEPNKRMLVWVDIVGPEGPKRAIPVRFNVTMPAMVTMMPMKQAEPVGGREPEEPRQPSLQDAQRASRGRSHESPSAPVDRRSVVPLSAAPAAPAAPAGQDARQAVPQHARGDRPGGETTHAVRRGEWVRLQSLRGSLSIEVSAEVLQDAHVGQRVRVKPRHAFTSVFARVIEPGLLEAMP